MMMMMMRGLSLRNNDRLSGRRTAADAVRPSKTAQHEGKQCANNNTSVLPLVVPMRAAGEEEGESQTDGLMQRKVL